MIRYRYVLVYRLNPNKILVKFADRLAKDKGIKVVRIALNLADVLSKGKAIYYPSVNEWISLFVYADYIITDSFHGTAFSINLNKNFYVFYPDKFSVRLRDILELTNLAERRIENPHSEYLDVDIQYSKVNSIIERERERIDYYLYDCLSKIKIEK